MSGNPTVTQRKSHSQTRSNRSRSLSAIRSRRSSRSSRSRSSSSRSRSNRSTGSRGSSHVSEFDGMHREGHAEEEFDPKGQSAKVLDKAFVEKFKDNVWNNDGAWIKTFLILSCFSAVVILAFECALFGLFLTNFKYEIKKGSYNPLLAIYGFYQGYLTDKKYAVAAYLALYIYAEIYQVLMTLVVLYTRNVFHLFSSIIFLMIMAIYSGIQYYEMVNTLASLNDYQALFSAFKSMLSADQPIGTVKGLSIVVMALCCLTCVVQAFVGWRLKDKFQRTTGEAIGINAKMVSANTFFNIHRDALLLAFFFCPGYFLQAVIIAPNKNDAEFGCSIAALVISIVVILMADYFASREMKLASITSTAWYILFLAFIIVKLVRIYTENKTDTPDLPGYLQLWSWFVQRLLQELQLVNQSP
ncbi:unnamed protein product [Ambrosiozyma monospora]|uniref:Unnamed protein product n=1 Tax=Ambrosiozyma monospora TaxID=43982 RepID=A0ACB5SRG8_AMBMO|nr:unnamed protein product [Ambrosiozyma monospora]